MRFALVGALLLALCIAGAGIGAASDAAGHRLDIPFVEQVKEGCGSAAIAMVFGWWRQHGHPGSSADAIDVAQVHRAVYRDAERGARASDVTRFFEQHGFRTHAFPGTWEDIKEHLGKGRPLIVALRPGGQRQLHYVVLSGVNDSHVLVHDPASRPFRAFARRDFEKQWAASGQWTLLALPPQ